MCVVVTLCWYNRKPVSWRFETLVGIIRLTCADITFPFGSGSMCGHMDWRRPECAINFTAI